MMTIVAIINAFKALLETYPLLPSLKRLADFLLMFLALIVFWAGLNIVRERDIAQGLKVAFFDSALQDVQRQNQVRAQQLQDELKTVALTNKTIQGILQAVTVNTPGAKRARFAVIHNGVFGITGIGLLHYDIISSFALPSVRDGDMAQNQPIGNWDDFIHPLLGGECAFVKVENMQDIALKKILETTGVTALSACPVIDSRNQIMGALFVIWVHDDPPEEQIPDILKKHLAAASEIAGAMELRR